MSKIEVRETQEDYKTIWDINYTLNGEDFEEQVSFAKKARNGREITGYNINTDPNTQNRYLHITYKTVDTISNNGNNNRDVRVNIIAPNIIDSFVTYQGDTKQPKAFYRDSSLQSLIDGLMGSNATDVKIIEVKE